jgi:phosphotransferase family enzyme
MAPLPSKIFRCTSRGAEAGEQLPQQLPLVVGELAEDGGLGLVPYPRHLAETTDPGLVPDPDAVRAVWADAVAAPSWAGPALWLHADLHPANLLTSDGTFCGVIDFGDMCAGDPACNLAACWILLPDSAIGRFHEAYQPLRTPRPCAAPAAGRWGGPSPASSSETPGIHGRPGGKATWGPPARAALQRLTATARR